jgi:RNA-directed DNA polymerase
VVQNALRLILEPVFEPDFQDGSYGYRPRRTPKDAIERVNNAIVCEKSRVIDLDLKNYFGSVRHHILLSKIAGRINDDRIMRLLKLILKAGGKRGVPQGGSLSPLMSNIYLNEVDKMLEKAKRVTTEKGKYTRIEYARWADDLVVLVGWHSQQDWLWKGIDRRIREELKKLEVEINEEKTRYVYLNRQEQFSFLSFNFLRKTREGKKPKSLCMPKMEARTKLIAKLREVFRRKVSRPIAEVVALINPILRGWLNYFRMGNSSRAFSCVKRWVIEKIRRHIMRAKGRGGFGWKRWNDKELLAMHKVYSDYTIPSKRPNPYRQAMLL